MSAILATFLDFEKCELVTCGKTKEITYKMVAILATFCTLKSELVAISASFCHFDQVAKSISCDLFWHLWARARC